MCERFLLENNKFGENQAMGEINGAVAIYLMLNICLTIYASQYMSHNICLTAKTICAIDLANNISHISILLKIECFIKENEVKCKKAFIKVHTDKYPIIMLILWFFVGSPFVC